MGSRFYAYFLLYFFSSADSIEQPHSFLSLLCFSNGRATEFVFFVCIFFLSRFVPCDFCFSLFGAFWLYLVLFCFDSDIRFIPLVQLFAVHISTSYHSIHTPTHTSIRKVYSIAFFSSTTRYILMFRNEQTKIKEVQRKVVNFI